MADLIDRAALLKDMGLTDAVKYGNKTAEQQNRSYSTWMSYEIADAIQDAPSVNRWIPCSERLPEDNAEVLVSFCRRYVKIGYIEPGDGLRYWVIPGHTVAPLNYIEAWMPMPDAYEPTEKE